MYEGLKNKGSSKTGIRHTIKENQEFELIRIEATSKETGNKTILICNTVNEAKEKFGKRFKNFKVIDIKILNKKRN